MIELATFPSLVGRLATTGGTFDPAPWIIGGLIAIALGAAAMLVLNRRRAAGAKGELDQGAPDGELSAAVNTGEVAGGSGNADGHVGDDEGPEFPSRRSLR